MDLNPQNYNLNEITSFFGLQPNHSFTQVNDAFRKKHNEITLSPQVPKEQKDKMLFFINQLKNKLILHLTKQNVSHNTFSNSLLPSSNFMNKNNGRVDTVINSAVAYNAGVSKEISADIINPIERNILKNVIHFDTRFKQNYVIENQSKFTFNFPTAFKNVISSKLISFELPDTIYNITEKLGNNTFNINILTGTTSDNDTKVTINEGKYTSSTLITEVERALDAISNNFTVSLSADTNLITITHASENFVLRFPGVKDKVNLGYILGFRSEVVNSTSDSVTASKVADFNFNNYFYLSFDDFQRSVNHNHFAIMNKNFVTKNIFAKLKNKADDGNTDYFVKKNYFGPVSLEKVSFELLDRYGNSLDLKGLDYSFSVEIELLYKF